MAAKSAGKKLSSPSASQRPAGGANWREIAFKVFTSQTTLAAIPLLLVIPLVLVAGKQAASSAEKAMATRHATTAQPEELQALIASCVKDGGCVKTAKNGKASIDMPSFHAGAVPCLSADCYLPGDASVQTRENGELLVWDNDDKGKRFGMRYTPEVLPDGRVAWTQTELRSPYEVENHEFLASQGVDFFD
jgi:hypothetical protein